jgi:hypothetical protein
MRFLVRRELVVIVVCALAASISHGAQFAFDSAGDSAYNTSDAAIYNGGYGWGSAWSIPVRTYVFFVGSSTLNGEGDTLGTGDINSPRTAAGRAWGLQPVDRHGIPPPQISVSRSFNGALLAGQTFSIDFDVNARTPGEFALALTNAHGEQFGVYVWPTLYSDYLIEGFGADYTARRQRTGVTVTSHGVHIDFSVLSDSQVQFKLTSLTADGASTVTIVPFSGALTGFEVDNISNSFFRSSNLDNLYFNNISVTPEPATGALLALAGSSLLLRRRQSKRTLHLGVG